MVKYATSITITIINHRPNPNLAQSKPASGSISAGEVAPRNSTTAWHLGHCRFDPTKIRPSVLPHFLHCGGPRLSSLSSVSLSDCISVQVKRPLMSVASSAAAATTTATTPSTTATTATTIIVSPSPPAATTAGNPASKKAATLVLAFAFDKAKNEKCAQCTKTKPWQYVHHWKTMRPQCQITVKRIAHQTRFRLRCQSGAGKPPSSFPFSFQFFTRLAAVFVEEVGGCGTFTHDGTV